MAVSISSAACTIIKPRLQERRLRLELQRRRLLRLRAERASLRKQVPRHPPGLAAQRKQFLRDRDHLPGAVHLVVGRLHAQLDLIGHSREILLGLGELRLALAQDGSLSTAFEQIDARAKADRAEAPGKERHVLLEAVAGEHIQVRDELVLGEANGRLGLLDPRTRFRDLRMRLERCANAGLALATLGGALGALTRSDRAAAALSGAGR